VLCVVLLRELLADAQKPYRTDREAAPLEAPKDLAGEAALHRVRLDEDEGALDRHEAEI
jgi:hypothetical protein